MAAAPQAHGHPVQTLYTDLAQKLANAPSPRAAKRQKDLRQASILFEVLDQAAPDELEDALDDARGSWTQAATRPQCEPARAGDRQVKEQWGFSAARFVSPALVGATGIEPVTPPV